MNVNRNRVLIDLSASPNCQFGKIDYTQQSAEQKVFSAIWSLESEVNNGGFALYFENSSAAEINDVVAALQAIGANRMAEVVAKAIAAFPDGPPRGSSEVGGSLLPAPLATVERWNQLDQEFFAYLDNLTNLLYDFVKARPQDFGPIS
jgi:hypothetical protein